MNDDGPSMDDGAPSELNFELPWALDIGAQRLAARHGMSFDDYIAHLIRKTMTEEDVGDGGN